MTKGNLTNNTKTRRKGSMLQDSLSKMKYLFVLAVLLVLPMQAMAQLGGFFPVINQTDTGVDRLVAFFDTRDRDTFIQVTNTSDMDVSIHVQIYDVTGPAQDCEQCDFNDILTAHDTHVYDIDNLVTNATSSEQCSGLPDGETHGFMVISHTDGPNDSLIGMFRIIDASGYEYRANAAGSEDQIAVESNNEIVNFNLANGNNLSDLVGITYVSLDTGNVHADPNIVAIFGSAVNQILIYDQAEQFNSCSPTTFSCAPGNMDKGIDNALPNSKDGTRVCATSTLNSNSSGWLHLPFNTFSCTDGVFGNPDGTCTEDPFFVGFIGLNNGNGTGSMDSWWEDGSDL
jgi:hypothetical protein